MNSWKPSKGSRGCAQCLRRNHLKVAAPEPVIWVGAERRAEGKKKPAEINRLKVKGDFFFPSNPKAISAFKEKHGRTRFQSSATKTERIGSRNQEQVLKTQNVIAHFNTLLKTCVLEPPQIDHRGNLFQYFVG